MNIYSVKTEIITPNTKTIYEILDIYLHSLKEHTIIAIASKVVSICEGRIVKVGTVKKVDLVRSEANYYLPSEEERHNISLSIKRNTLIPTSGIDESNGCGYYVLWPADPQETANRARGHLCHKFGLKEIGVIITDSNVTPLRWGTSGIAIAHSGFLALNDYRDTPDVFGKPLKATQANIANGLAAAAVVIMGEGSERKPLVIIENLPFVQFQPRNPTDKELANLYISASDDLYAPLLEGVTWEKGTPLH